MFTKHLDVEVHWLASSIAVEPISQVARRAGALRVFYGAGVPIQMWKLKELVCYRRAPRTTIASNTRRHAGVWWHHGCNELPHAIQDVVPRAHNAGFKETFKPTPRSNAFIATPTNPPHTHTHTFHVP